MKEGPEGAPYAGQGVLFAVRCGRILVFLAVGRAVLAVLGVGGVGRAILRLVLALILALIVFFHEFHLPCVTSIAKNKADIQAIPCNF